MTRLARFLPDNLWARFALLLTVCLVGANLVAAVLLAREGSVLDQTVRMQRDLGRLVALVETLEEADEASGRAILRRSGTGYTRFSIDSRPITPDGGRTLHHLVDMITPVLPGHEVRVVSGMPLAMEQNVEPLIIMAVQLSYGVYAGKWLNILVYPLTPALAWTWKAGFFVPLGVSLAGSLLVGIWFTRRMTAPLRRLTATVVAAGNGNHAARLPETGAKELRDAAHAFNVMQQKISDFDSARHQLLAAIGHDLITPITSLRVRAEISSDKEMAPDMLRILDEMTVMARDLLNYTRNTETSESLGEVDLSELTAQICADHGADYVASAPVVLKLRRAAITRAIGNLVCNAMRYAGAAEVAIHQTAKRVAIVIEDRGPGLPEDKLEAVKQPFVRGEKSRSTITGGIGLGLAIADKIVLSHGGSLTLSNREGGGLRAELSLPRCG